MAIKLRTSRLPAPRALVNVRIASYKNACIACTLCTMILVIGTAVFCRMRGCFMAGWMIVAASLPLLVLSSLFTTSCFMAHRELVRMPETWFTVRREQYGDEELAVRLINNNSMLLSEHLCLLSEQEKAEVQMDRLLYPTPENTPYRSSK